MSYFGIYFIYNWYACSQSKLRLNIIIVYTKFSILFKFINQLQVLECRCKKHQNNDKKQKQEIYILEFKEKAIGKDMNSKIVQY